MIEREHCSACGQVKLERETVGFDIRDAGRTERNSVTTERHRLCQCDLADWLKRTAEAKGKSTVKVRGLILTCAGVAATVGSAVFALWLLLRELLQAP